MTLYKYDDGHYPLNEAEQESNWQIYIEILYKQGLKRNEIMDCCILENINEWEAQVDKFYENKKYNNGNI